MCNWARLSNVLSALSAALWYCNHFDQELEMDGWLPHETPNGAAPVRSVKAFVFQQAKLIWEWCLRTEGGATRFLHCDIWFSSHVHRERPQPTPVRTLGEVLAELRLEKAAFDRCKAPDTMESNRGVPPRVNRVSQCRSFHPPRPMSRSGVRPKP